MKTQMKSLRLRTRSWWAERRIERKIRVMFGRWVDRKGFVKSQNMEEAAESIGVTVEQLRFYLNKKGYKPFLILRKQLRVKEAVEIMRADPGRKLDAVAVDVGIMDVRNFRRQFEETMGVSLSVWRKSLRKSK